MHRTMIVMGTVMALVGCGENTVAPTHDTDVTAQYVTGRAAQQLVNGHYRTQPWTPSWQGEMTPDQADSLADWYVQSQLVQIAHSVEYERGSSIDFAKLARCQQHVYAATPFDDPGTALTVYQRVMLGSQWVVKYCGQGGDEEVAVSVYAPASTVHISKGHATGQLECMCAPWQVQGIQAGYPLPITPESAAVYVAKLTGTRVTDVPRYTISNPNYGSADFGAWEVPVDHAVAMTAHGQATSETVLYVAVAGADVHTLALYRPARDASGAVIRVQSVYGHTLARTPMLEQATLVGGR